MNGPHPHMAHAQLLMAKLGVSGDQMLDAVLSAFDRLPITDPARFAESRLARLFSDFTSAGTERMRHFTITDPKGDPYLTRYFVEEYADGSGVFLHHIHRSDSDREYHDHPWDFRSYIVSGGYHEHTPDEPPRTFKRGTWNTSPATRLHRLELTSSEAWTIVFHGPKVRAWGFANARDGVWVHNEEYLAKKFGDAPWTKVD